VSQPAVHDDFVNLSNHRWFHNDDRVNDNRGVHNCDDRYDEHGLRDI
jgi:hypothetical protein